MLKTRNIPFLRTQKWSSRPDLACCNHLFLSKLSLTGDMKLRNLKKLHEHVDLSMLTHFSYRIVHGPFRESHLAKILKKAKNLKVLVLNLEYAAEKYDFYTLMKAVGQLKLRKLKIVYRQNRRAAPYGFFEDLIRLLKKMQMLESLELKFEGITFKEQFYDSIPYTFPFHNLTRLYLGYKEIGSNIDKWIIPFSRAVGKALYRNLADLNKISIGIFKDACPHLTPFGISKFLTNFDKIHLTNYLDLKVKSGYRQPEEYSNYGFGDLFLMLMKRQAKFKLNALDISTLDLSGDLKALTQTKRNLLVNYLYWDISDSWTGTNVQEAMNYVKHIQPQKGVKLTFPTWVRQRAEESEHDEDSDYYADYDEDIHGPGDDELLDLVVVPILAQMNKNASLCLDFSDSAFDNSDYELLQSILENVHKPISRLELRLARACCDNDDYGDMDEQEIGPAMVRLVCSLYNVKTCVLNANELDFEYYNQFEGLKDSAPVNKKSSLEKIEFEIDNTKMKPKALLQILKVWSQIPKLKTIDVICTEAHKKACQSIKTLKSKTGNVVTCNFIVE